MSVIDDSGLDVANSDAEPWVAEMRELLAAEAPFEPADPRRRTVVAILLILGLIAVGILIVLAGSALGSDPGGGCGGG